ncbi:uncharacterized protein [Chelonus insularis]|uniref:uncharacterized protein isoform X1 n=1 Tax=Chelonus insularis TaxID=460826 RepID=UPI0015897903|nr:uncharacterized protein LOC118064543 isoform X1 [Chelonus insularis]
MEHGGHIFVFFLLQFSSFSSLEMLRDALLPLLLVIGSVTKSFEDSAVFLFPKSSVFQFTIGVSVPLITSKKGSVVFSAGFQFNYALPWNSTQFKPSIIPARDIQDFNLTSFYLFVENFLDMYGWKNSRHCLLRSICELAKTPLSRNSGDAAEEIIHLVLTPTEVLHESINSNYSQSEKLYQDAEQLGRSGSDCSSTYPNCIESPLESFTRMIMD